MGSFEQQLELELEDLRAAALLRRLRPLASAHGPRVSYQGRTVIMLSSNNYLGLAAEPALKRAATGAIERWGVGAAASRLVAGSLELCRELEQRLARLKGTQAALVFGSGYLANIGVIPALAGSNDIILSDELNHASLIDGCRLAHATVRVYRHRDLDHLKVLLQDARGARRRLIITDSVFSMDGDVAPLADIVELARRFNAAVMIDEAHAVGVLGPGGAGLAAALGLQAHIDVQMGTLSKALGSYGAYVAGSERLVEFLINRARGFIYTTGLAPAMAAAASAALELLEQQPERIRQLWDNAAYLKERLKDAGFTVMATDTPILPVLIGSAQAALDLEQALLARNVFVVAIRPPTVPPGTARLRVTPIATHSRQDLEQAAQAFTQCARELGLNQR
ncbi:MAG TPA: 8-amino-7-oxononanoate synthase [Candidatus Binataceae bacterium]|nr:8-amino-7-oxononanoate synthase [Candidatus Binataceae bacterium]